MKRQLLPRDEDGVSQVIGTILIMVMMVTIVGTMLAWGIPQIQNNEAWAQYATTRSNLLNLDADMDQVLLQGEGASRTSTVSLGSGSFTLKEAQEDLLLCWSTVSWAQLSARNVEEGATILRVEDLTETAGTLTVTLTYPNGTIWSGETDGNRLGPIPPVVAGLSGTAAAANGTAIGEFRYYKQDILSYKYRSTAGQFQMRLFNGAVLAHEPGGGYYFEDRPLVRGSGNVDALSLYLVSYNNSGSQMRSMTGPSNFDFSLRNQGGSDSGSIAAYSLRIVVKGDAQYATYGFFQSQWGFSRDQQYDEVYLTQVTSLDLRLMERTVHVSFGLR
ncbi:MAG: hypothetical protein BEU05_03110 [Marine Group III euryarchaeote CG-Bathy2]|uniref:Uncharacterized protein n=2 Tax=Methanobacteriati TaxID=3366610 RepID=A0A075GQK5_9EURY|nr:hypothetical protein [uncultured marine group II/III euryarchaeote KM3_181_H05]OIR12267.1 MAG: hypothetical protein BEU05_03110 [Marine Group III euryarchaeote CG-Bathy2]